jgi:hypothetical protein
VSAPGDPPTIYPDPLLFHTIHLYCTSLPADAQRPPPCGVTDSTVPPLLVSYFQFMSPTVIIRLGRLSLVYD